MRSFLTIIVALLITGQAECQLSSGGGKLNPVSPDDTLALNTYRRLMEHNYDLINGKEYIIYHKLYHSNPCFKSATVAGSIIYYNGRSYNDFKILYDIYKDELVVNYLNSTGYLKLVCLNKHCVDSFDIYVDNVKTRFLSLFFPPESQMKNGFYEVPFRGKTSLLIKHLKTYYQKDAQDEYIDSIVRYLYINGKYYPVTSLSRFCKLFGEKKSEIRKYIRLLHVISFRRISDTELLQILEYYENLN